MKKLLWCVLALAVVTVAAVLVAGRRETPKQDDGTRRRPSPLSRQQPRTSTARTGRPVSSSRAARIAASCRGMTLQKKATGVATVATSEVNGRMNALARARLPSPLSSSNSRVRCHNSRVASSMPRRSSSSRRWAAASSLSRSCSWACCRARSCSAWSCASRVAASSDGVLNHSGITQSPERIADTSQAAGVSFGTHPPRSLCSVYASQRSTTSGPCCLSRVCPVDFATPRAASLSARARGSSPFAFSGPEEATTTVVFRLAMPRSLSSCCCLV